MIADAAAAAPLRVLLVDDQQLLRRGLAMLLSTADGIDVVGQAADGTEALAVLGRERDGVDVLLTDARMPGMDGMELTAACRERWPDLPVLMLTTFDDEAVVRGALGAGASGFLLKDTSTDALADALRAVAAGGMVIDPRVARIALSRDPAGGGAAAADPLAVLTRTERLVAELVADGRTNAEIASVLVLAEGTVKNHVSSLLRKLDQRDRTGLALALYKTMRG
ncbi:response regulator transcription factor [Brachybacterium nesterenkovii]|uniref:Putative two-component system response regulator n=1 Tax=Brachybacterium nesterenkovii TaxID=47847 RepID=A0A1X6X773_9MICO|nr:response regulator transcription factor [Brachybacterium nesterenkovii]SLM95174.1 putative two-component system response regulator [Brachybacterium nesterenkovii]